MGFNKKAATNQNQLQLLKEISSFAKFTEAGD